MWAHWGVPGCCHLLFLTSGFWRYTLRCRMSLPSTIDADGYGPMKPAALLGTLRGLLHVCSMDRSLRRMRWCGMSWFVVVSVCVLSHSGTNYHEM